jgi:hypothetical protein
MTEDVIRETTRALLLGAGALYATSVQPTEAEACYYCQATPQFVYCAWDSWNNQNTCFVTANSSWCDWGSYWACS